jgi:hypothetical protein
MNIRSVIKVVIIPSVAKIRAAIDAGVAISRYSC